MELRLNVSRDYVEPLASALFNIAEILTVTCWNSALFSNGKYGYLSEASTGIRKRGIEDLYGRSDMY